MELPIKIYRNDRWFANLEWYLFKYFHIKRKIPCGRTKKNSYLCCNQSYDPKRIYFNLDRTKAYCKVCNSIRYMSNHSLPNNPWALIEFEEGEE